jgi:hypothetical protein
VGVEKAAEEKVAEEKEAEEKEAEKEALSNRRTRSSFDHPDYSRTKSLLK